MLSIVSLCLFSKLSSGSDAFVSLIVFCEEKKSLKTSALSLLSEKSSPWLHNGGILLDSEGLIICFNVFHQSLGPRVLLLSFSASLSFTACLDLLISLFT